MRRLAGYTLAITVAAAALVACAPPFPLDGRDVPDVKLTPPPGYGAITNAHFGYVVPKKWPGDLVTHRDLYRAASGSWLMYASYFTGCGKSEKLPKLVGYYAEADHYTVADSSRLDVPGASGAWRYDIVDAAGERHIAVNVWVTSGYDDDGHCVGDELWLVINVEEPQVGEPVAETIVDTLAARGYPE